MSRTLSSRPDISAIPPALSAIGPYASTATVLPVVASIPTAARAIPYTPAIMKATIIATAIRTTGNAQDCIPTARPLMIFVADPVSD